MRELVDAEALEVRPAKPDERWLTPVSERVGPLQWSLWLGAEPPVGYVAGPSQVSMTIDTVWATFAGVRRRPPNSVT